MTDSNWSHAVRSLREGFLLTPPRTLVWNTNGRHYVDDVPVSERVYDLAYRGDLMNARAAWLAEFDAR